MIGVVWSMYRNTKSQLKIDGTFSGDHQGSVLSPLLFIMLVFNVAVVVL